jgi:two-component system sensor histidine kinase VicK
VFVLRSVRNWLTLLFLVLTAMAALAVWLYVVPPLRTRLVNQKLTDLGASAPLITKSIEPVQIVEGRFFADPIELLPKLAAIDRRLNARLVVIAGDEEVIADSRSGQEPRLGNYPMIGRAVRSETTQVGTVRSRGEEFAVAAVPVTAVAEDTDESLGTVAVVLVLSSLRDVNSAVRLVTRQILLATVLAMAITLVAGYLVSYLISRRLKSIETSAEAIAGGDFDVTVGVRVKDEIGQLAATFNTMGGRLEEAFSALESEKRHVETLLNTLSEGVIGVTSDGRVAVANPAATAILGDRLEPGVSIDEAFPAEVAELWHWVRLCESGAGGAGDAAPCESGSSEEGAPFGGVPSDGTPIGTDAHLPAVSGTGQRLPEGEHQVVFELGARTLEASTHPASGGRAFDSIVVLRDVTEEARLERARRDFVANASHEFKTPLFSLSGILELLDEEGLDPHEQQEFLTMMKEQVERLQMLSLKLLDLSQVDAGAVRLNVGVADATAMAHSVLAEFHARAAERHIRTVVVAPPGSMPVSCDEERLAQVLRALLDNAIKYAPDGGTVEVRVSGDDGHVLLVVADNGVGIPPDELTRVFDRFYRGAMGRGSKAGTGLGLSIARDLTGLMGGTLTGESRVGVGSRFTIRLPAGQEEERRHGQATADRAAHAPTSAGSERS